VPADVAHQEHSRDLVLRALATTRAFTESVLFVETRLGSNFENFKFCDKVRSKQVR